MTATLSHGRIVGREHELAAVEQALDDLGRRKGGWLQIAGEPGIGKSRLLSELCERADERGFLVLTGRGAEYERDVPFGAVVDALDDYLAALPERRLKLLGRERLSELATVFPSLEEVVEERATGLQGERYRLHYAVRALLSRLAGERPLVLALDDLHWVDAASEELLGHLARRPPDGPVLIVTAVRPRQAPPRLTAALAATTREATAERLDLEPLSEADALTLVGDQADPERRAAVVQESGGNPFYLEQLLRAGARDGPAVPVFSTEEIAVPEAVRAALAGELEMLAPDARSVLESAAIAGEPFEPDVVAAIAEVPEREVLAALDVLLDADLVRSTSVPRRFRFRHPIVRRAVYESAAGGWRLAAHGRAAEALAQRGVPAALRAHHVERAAHPGDEEAIAVLTEAGHASASRAPATAARWYEAALRLLPDTEESFGRRLELLVPLAQAQGSSGRLVESRDALRELLRVLPPELMAMRARVAAFIARIEHPLGRHGEARAMLEGMLEELPDPCSPEGVSLRIELAADHFFLSDFEGMRERAQDALELAREVGDRLLIATAAAHLGMALQNLARTAESGAACDEAAAIIDELPDETCAAGVETFWWLGWCEQSIGRFEIAARHLERGIELSRSTGQSYGFVTSLMSLAVPLGWHGQLRRAQEIAEEATEAAMVSGNEQFVAWVQQIRCWIACRTGDSDDAVRWGEAAVQTIGELTQTVFSGLAHAHLGAAYLEAGDGDRGRAELLKADEQEGAPLEPGTRTWWEDLLARAYLMCGDVETAAHWAEKAHASAERMDLPYHRGVACRARAAVLLAQGDPAGARDAAARSVAYCEEVPEPVGAGRARVLQGRALARLDDREGAVALLERARADLTELGAKRYADEAARELRRLGKRVARRGKVAAGDSGVAALSGRELEIAEIVARGRTNKQIAAELFVSEKTVEAHLSRVFTKLGVSSRAQVAAAIERERAGAAG